MKSGIQTFEVRKGKDDIQVGDILIHEEWKPDGIFTGGYTGRCIRKRVKYVLRDILQYGLQEGYCIIGLEDINNGWIPCSKRLPETFHNVFICTKEGGRTIGHRCPNQKPGMYYNLHSSAIDNVIEWRELPAPYQPEEAAKI